MIRIHIVLTGEIRGVMHTTVGFFSEEAITDISVKLKNRIKSGDRLKDLSVSVSLNQNPDIWDGEYTLVVERAITITGKDLKTAVELIGDAINNFSKGYSDDNSIVSIKIKEITGEEI